MLYLVRMGFNINYDCNTYKGIFMTHQTEAEALKAAIADVENDRDNGQIGPHHLTLGTVLQAAQRHLERLELKERCPECQSISRNLGDKWECMNYACGGYFKPAHTGENHER